MTMEGLLAGARWRKSSFSGGGANGGGGCVEATYLAGGAVAVRDSKNPGGGAVLFTRAGLEALIGHITTG